MSTFNDMANDAGCPYETEQNRQMAEMIEREEYNRRVDYEEEKRERDAMETESMKSKLQYIEAPNLEPFEYESVFLAGGITDCPNWQLDVLVGCRSAREDLTLVNPRREDFPMNDPKAAPAQIFWEHLMLRRCDVISFWFPKETICPIVLYELGVWSMQDKPLVIGMDPEYPRRQDVEIQTQLINRELRISYNLDDHIEKICRRFRD